MNKSKSDLNKSETESNDKKRKMNIREIYLQALNSNRDFKTTQTVKKKSFTNITNDEKSANIGASNYLEKEYGLVKRILTDTKELKKIKNKKNTDGSKCEHHQTSTGCSCGCTTATTNCFNDDKLKSAEEYCREVLALKKSLKMYQNNELIYKAKFEYYENEMNKKEQEIMELLNVKKAEEIRLTTDSNTDLPTLIYGLKQKCFKLEFSLRRKENELNKLKTELKTTNLKELKSQNERLRVELSRALLNEKDIMIDERLPSRNGNLDELNIDLQKKIIELTDENEFLIKENKKLVKEKERLILNLNHRPNSRQSGGRSPIVTKDDSINDSDTDKKSLNKEKAAQFLYGVFKGHLQRTNSLNRINEKENEMHRQNKSPSIHSPSPSPDRRRRTPSPIVSRGRQESSKQQKRQLLERNYEEEDLFTTDDDTATPRNERKQLIQNRVGEVDETSCCGSLKASSKSEK